MHKLLSSYMKAIVITALLDFVVIFFFVNLNLLGFAIIFWFVSVCLLGYYVITKQISYGKGR